MLWASFDLGDISSQFYGPLSRTAWSCSNVHTWVVSRRTAFISNWGLADSLFLESALTG